MVIESSQFIDRKRQRWQALSHLLNKIQLKGFRNLAPGELKSLGELYREVSADLAFSKTHLGDEKLLHYLNDLVAKAHGYIYQTKPARLKALWQFYYYQFPPLFRQTSNFTLIAFGIFMFGALLGFFTALNEENFPILLIPPSIMESIEQEKMWTQDITSVAPLASSTIMTNNISVTFTAFALGITLGIGTFYILAFNGLRLGVIAYLITIHDMSLDFWSFVLPHGVIELTCIFISGGAGLILGSGLLLPSQLRRKDALTIKAKIAVKLVLGCIPPLIIAGIIEGFISPADFLPAWLKLLFALLAGFLFYLYLFTFPRKTPSTT
ncbi:MAG: stage II sporulation protein M [Candidatus Omnitrophota bacterium]|nr:MAG: stage II sporulation protein M [Candidatus Omnitrophota bacterium]